VLTERLVESYWDVVREKRGETSSRR
jgi:hypothetical protein